MRRTLMVTSAPILKSLRRMVAQVAWARSVPGKAIRRRLSDEDIGHRGEPQAQLVGAEGGSRGTIGKQIELTFLDAVFHLATCAVDLLVEMTRIPFGLRQGGDDEAWVCLVLRPLGLGNDATLAAPALAG